MYVIALVVGGGVVSCVLCLVGRVAGLETGRRVILNQLRRQSGRSSHLVTSLLRAFPARLSRGGVVEVPFPRGGVVGLQPLVGVVVVVCVGGGGGGGLVIRVGRRLTARGVGEVMLQRCDCVDNVDADAAETRQRRWQLIP